jgi:hypothetical protein
MTLSITGFSAIMLCVVNAGCAIFIVMLSVVMLNAIMLLSVVRLNVVMLSVVAPRRLPWRGSPERFFNRVGSCFTNKH